MQYTAELLPLLMVSLATVVGILAMHVLAAFNTPATRTNEPAGSGYNAAP